MITLYRFHPLPQPVLDSLVQPLREAFNMPVAIASKALKAGASSFYPERGDQYLARGLLQRLAAAPAPSRDAAAATAAMAALPPELDVRLGAAAFDLFSTGLNFVFGEASHKQHCAVISIARLDDTFYGLPRSLPDVFLRRCVTEAVHELGHVFGLGHCDSPSCVMWFSSTLQETDHKGCRLCHTCQARLDARLRRSGG